MVEIAVSTAVVTQRRAWLGQLRTACIMVSEQPPFLVKSVSMTQSFASVSVDERAELVTLAGRLAGEYGLMAETTGRSSVTVWISRLLPSDQTTASHPSKDERLVAS